MVTERAFIKGGENGVEFEFFHGLHSAHKPSTFGGSPAYFCLNVPRRFQINI